LFLFQFVIQIFIYFLIGQLSLKKKRKRKINFQIAPLCFFFSFESADTRAKYQMNTKLRLSVRFRHVRFFDSPFFFCCIILSVGAGSSTHPHTHTKEVGGISNGFSAGDGVCCVIG
jgi:hypothetical protein